MFQQETKIPSNMNEILAQELDSFKAVLQFSEKIVDQIDSLPISVLHKMVGMRQQWIDQIQKLEKMRGELAEQKMDENGKKMVQNISELAHKLVKIDDQIYAALRKRKNQYVKQHADLISARRNNKMTDGYSRVMDIIQE
ncbi:hypothetical protein [Caldithrix abyssi]|uniref:FlgN protein n=1 Tax=Caldithrix abyssi DSM 13497 TaxID=880073 RepID=H1XPA0_CALAY|nr:hypothetical protein [Caldithrix abyssi]APF18187.1 hypothetical protein Cabys_1438 [Caldithrix abyssi DSM 13497]EHO42215.1 hypothetical protein Calab_2605 [Caldithrix abyssi DSM 13497]